jgi:hypothetical protein
MAMAGPPQIPAEAAAGVAVLVGMAQILQLSSSELVPEGLFLTVLTSRVVICAVEMEVKIMTGTVRHAPAAAVEVRVSRLHFN